MSNRGYRGGLALALALLCLGIAVPAAAAAELPYTLDEELSLTGDCSTTPGVDEVKDPDCEPTYPPPPNGPSGRFDRPFSLAVDDWGNLYVASRSGDGTEGRIDVFDSEGRFITELDDPFGPWSIAVDGEGNLYAFERQVGVPGAPDPEIVYYPPTVYNPAAGEISYDPDDRTSITSNFAQNALAIDRLDPDDPSDDRLFVAEDFKVEIYGSAEEGNPLLHTITGLSSAATIALDAERRLLYVTHCKSGSEKCVVRVYDADAPYALVTEITGSQVPAGKFLSTAGQISLAVDETNGHLFIGDLSKKPDIYELDENYAFVSTFLLPGSAQNAAVHSDVAETPKDPGAKNHRYLYVPISATSGSAIAFAPPSIGPPLIESSAARNIGEVEAEVEAMVHPKQLATDYAIEYVSAEQFEIDGFESATLAKSGTLPGADSPQRISALLSGLEPGQGYRFRIFAENELGEAEEEGAFTTYDDAPISSGPCPNETLRVGLSAALPDCRAWELVTPPGARGPEGAGLEGQRFGMVHSSPDGSKLSFEIKAGALPGTEASGYFFGDPYTATRTASGWSTEHTGPTGTMASKPTPGSSSPDQEHVFWTAGGEGSAVIGSGGNYIRYSDGHSELVGQGSLGTDPQAIGRLITEGGTHVVFESGAGISPAVQLEPAAPPGGTRAVYDRTADGTTHVVSLLPGEVTPTADAFYAGASADGEGIAFEVEDTLYLRLGNKVTYLIGAGVEFAGVSEAGERIFYLEGGDLKAFDTATEEVVVFADTAAAVIPVNVAPEGSRAYFVSETATGAANPNGDTAQPGEPNLYLSTEGAITFVATVTDADVKGVENTGTKARGEGLGLYLESLAKQQPAIVSSRLTADGGVLAFSSRANLDGYEPGEEAQIYRYDSGAERLHCVSCPPTEIPGAPGAAFQTLGTLTPGVPLNSAYAFVPALASGGERLFFESTEALVSTDTDELRDVYEWEEEGLGSCDREGGCLYLISSGQSARPDFLFGHSQSGDDVFVSTADVLVPGMPQAIAIYDARVGGGFPAPAPIVCAEEGCRPDLTPPPPLSTPQSPVGPSGNLPPQASKPKKCPKGKRKVKRKGKVICVKKHKKQRKGGKAGSSRGAGR